MNIKFYNLGKIRETELDLRPLTVIIGPNNSNKTYIAYSVYALWERLGSSEIEAGEEDFQPLPTDIFSQLSEHQKEYIPLDLGNFFQDSSHKLFDNTKLNFNISKEEIEENLKKLFDRRKQQSSRNIPVIPGLDPDFMGDEDIIVEDIDISKLLFPTPLALPAERNTLILTYKLLSNRRYKLMKDTQRQIFSHRGFNKNDIDLVKAQSIGYPQPIEDFLDFLTDVEMAREPDAGPEFRKLADDIEQQMQERNKVYLEPVKLGGKEIRIRVKQGLDIDLYNASSAIRQLTPLILYLRYRAKINDFIVIDEPEMNLHPESQAKLLEVFGIMISLGVRILITTHSPYLLAHLNNLVSGAVETPEILREQAASSYLKDPRAFLSMDQVSAYEMKNDKLHSLKDEDYGIRWDTLSDVSSDIQQKYFEIHEKKEIGEEG
ncbi:ATP-binding protein [Desulfobacterales bacterium HSG2]|nr:ATP-binding protein [Desulfobacterales bacterium HSG2]MDM8548528.1 ATP-binding protein [Desulfobacterales bacterium HSG2]